MSLTIRHKYKNFTLLFRELKTAGKSFIFAVCRLTYDHVTSSLISLFPNAPALITRKIKHSRDAQSNTGK